jgi:glyoxylase-like metal-dependent hydrolase (beta-lactamase superfamily II)
MKMNNYRKISLTTVLWCSIFSLLCCKNDAMTQQRIFQFNSFQVNTFVIWDETKECIIIDPGCLSEKERTILTRFIADNQLKPVHLLNTHYHIDHILGNKYVNNYYRLPVEAHSGGSPFWENTSYWAANFGLKHDDLVAPDAYLQNGDEIKFGNSSLKVLYTPGHADGSICFYNKDEKYVIVGDVLFHTSIGRTDLPTGNYDVLKQSIKEKLFTLPDKTVVYPGHGQQTTIGYEKVNNPFL